MRPGARDEKAHVAEPLHQPGQRLERELKALLVHEPPHEHHEALVRLRELPPEPVEVVDGLQVERVDPVRDHGHARLLEAVDVGHVAAHVMRAGDHAVRTVGHPSLHAVDMRLRVVVDPALVPTVLGGVDRHHQRAAEAVGQVVAGHRDEPIVAVHEVEVEAVAQLHARGQHVRVHVLDPGDEFPKVARAPGLAHAMDEYAVELVLGRHPLVAAREHVDLDILHGDELLGELAHVARQAALDQRRVLPGEDEDAGHSAVRDSCGARLRRSGSAEPIEARARSSSAAWPSARSRG